MTDKTGLLVVPHFYCIFEDEGRLIYSAHFLSLLFFSGNRIRR
ncbi:hypothetical protein [Pectobacterium jejuense]|uniref:Uncharacterized protein n=1 Tax=Pectobacterium jejuense TaxID=2974022 RepID=A0ABW8GYQ5_9GAMM